MGSKPSKLRVAVVDNDLFGVMNILRPDADKATELISTDFSPDESSLAGAKNDFNVLHTATLLNRLEILETLLEYQANPNTPTRSDGQTALHLAARTNNLDAVVLLLRFGADLRAEDRAGRLPLHVAAGSSVAAVRNKTNVLRHLVKAGRPKLVRAKDVNGETPLHYAVRAENLRAARYLVKHGADYAAENCRGQTARDVASRQFRKLMDENFVPK